MKRYLSILKKAESLFKDSDPSVRYQVKQIEVQAISCLALLGYPIDFDSMAHFQEYTVSIQDLKNALGDRFSDIYYMNKKRQELLSGKSYGSQYESIEESMNRILSSRSSSFSSGMNEDKKQINDGSLKDCNVQKVSNDNSESEKYKSNESIRKNEPASKRENETKERKIEGVKSENREETKNEINDGIKEENSEEAKQEIIKDEKEIKDETDDEMIEETEEEIDEEIEEIEEIEEADEFEPDMIENDIQADFVSTTEKQETQNENEDVSDHSGVEKSESTLDMNYPSTKTDMKAETNATLTTIGLNKDKADMKLSEEEINRVNEQNIHALSNMYGVSMYEPIEVVETDLVYGKDYVGIPPVNSNDALDHDHIDKAGSDNKKAGSNDKQKQEISDNTKGKDINFTPEDPNKFKQFLHKKDLTFVYDYVTVSLGNRKEEAEIIVYPLNKEGQDIIVWCLFNGKTIVKYTEEKKHVLIPLLDARLLVSGELVDGTFKVTIKLPKKDQARGDKLQVDEEVWDGKDGHIAVYDDERHIEVHVFPTTFKNNQTQNADYFYYIKTDEEVITGDTNDNPFVYIQTGPYKLEIVARWDEKTEQVGVCAQDGI